MSCPPLTVYRCPACGQLHNHYDRECALECQVEMEEVVVVAADTLRRAAEERDEAIRLLANATDPENRDDWDEAREVGWTWVRHRDPLGGQS